jgi:hypothetical protein
VTIAACYLSSEGVVFGADSTTTMLVQGPEPGGTEHHFNFAQKIFEIGQDSSLGITTWGLGGLGEISYRTLIAQFGDELSCQPVCSIAEVAERWNAFFWPAYSTALAPVLTRVQELRAQATRTPEEESELQWLIQQFFCGFCLGGNCHTDRTPAAFEMTFAPSQAGPSPPQALAIGSAKFWGCPNLIDRLIYGMDDVVFQGILGSGHWSGTPDELLAVVRYNTLAQPSDLPLREAIDWVHSCIYITSKAMKFSHLPPVCGGPVEIAVISSDRKFRWVRHKRFDVAITQDFPAEA